MLERLAITLIRPRTQFSPKRSIKVIDAPLSEVSAKRFNAVRFQSKRLGVSQRLTPDRSWKGPLHRRRRAALRFRIADCRPTTSVRAFRPQHPAAVVGCLAGNHRTAVIPRYSFLEFTQPRNVAASRTHGNTASGTGVNREDHLALCIRKPHTPHLSR